jgi:hypothetical protein
MIPVKERGIHFTTLHNSAPDPQAKDNPIRLGGHVMSPTLPTIEPRPVLRKGICPSNRRKRINQIGR